MSNNSDKQLIDDVFQEYRSLISDMAIGVHVCENESMFAILTRSCKTELQPLVDDKLMGIIQFVRSKYQITMAEAQALHHRLLEEMAQEYFYSLLQKEAEKNQKNLQEVNSLCESVINMMKSEASTVKH